MGEERKIEIFDDAALYQRLTREGVNTELTKDGSLILRAPLTLFKNKVVKLTLPPKELRALVMLSEEDRNAVIEDILNSIEIKIGKIGIREGGALAILPKRRAPKTDNEKQFVNQIRKRGMSGDILVIGHSWANGVTEYGRAVDLESRFRKAGLVVKIDSVCVDGAHLGEVVFATEHVVEKRAGKGYKFVVVMVGGNDLGLPVEKIVEGIETQYKAALQLSEHVFVCNFHPYTPHMKKIMDANRLLDGSKVIPRGYLVDVYTVMDNLKDHAMHPKRGYVPVRDVIVEKVVETLGVRRQLLHK